MLLTARRTRLLPLLLLAVLAVSGQDSDPASLVTTGQVDVNGHEFPFRIRHLPVSSYPDLPSGVAVQLVQRGCLIPQTYEAHHPENVVHGSFQRPGSSDWAVLCSEHGEVSLLVFFAANISEPMTLATSRETDRLQRRLGSTVLGFNWGIDNATPNTVHNAQIGMSPRPPLLDHDVVADSVVDRTTVYHFYAKGAWSLIDMPQ